MGFQGVIEACLILVYNMYPATGIQYLHNQSLNSYDALELCMRCWINDQHEKIWT